MGYPCGTKEGGNGGTYICAFAGHVLVIFASVGRLSALLSDDSELLGREHSLPLVVVLLDWIVRHISFLLRAKETS